MKSEKNENARERITAKQDTYTMYGSYSGSDSYLLMGYAVTL